MITLAYSSKVIFQRSVVLALLLGALVLTGPGCGGDRGNGKANNGDGAPEPIDISGYGIDPTLPYPETQNHIYYLDANNGNDISGDGTSLNPWQTLAKAQSIMASGDTIILRDGNYGRFYQYNSDNRTDWITFKADTGHTPVIAGLELTSPGLMDTYLRFDRIDFSFGDADSMFGVNLRYVRHLEIRNSNISNYNHKYESDTAVRITHSENILIYYCDISIAKRGITVSNSQNTTISKNHIHHLGGSSGISYGGWNHNFIIEKNNVYDSNFDTNDIDPDSPYTADNPSGFPHASGVAIRSNNVWIQQNIFHDIGSSSGMMFYSPDAAGGEAAYRNIIIENNLLYDIQNVFVIRMNNLGTNVIVKNNTFVGHLRDTTNACYRLRQALSVHSLADGYDGSGLSVYNNIMVGSVNLPQAAKTGNNIFWTYSLYDAPHDFLSAPPDPGTKVLTDQASYYPIEYFATNFFAGVDEEVDFVGDHNQFLDYRLHVDSEAVDFGDTNTQSANSLGSIDANGFIQDDGPVRDTDHHSAGAYEHSL